MATLLESAVPVPEDVPVNRPNVVVPEATAIAANINANRRLAKKRPIHDNKDLFFVDSRG
jgi:hypothetical protein